jgi:FdhD protein
MPPRQGIITQAGRKNAPMRPNTPEELAVAGELSKEKMIVAWRDGETAAAADQVVVEAPLTIYLNGAELITLLCTPDKLDRLAIGFLRSEGILASLDEVTGLRVRQDEGLVEVELKRPPGPAGRIYGKRTITSGCGKGTVFFNALDALRSKPLAGKISLQAAQVLALMRAMQEKALLFKATGGVHGAALADPERILIFCEDIGRHNAVDKIAGECLLTGVSLEDKILLSTGRMSAEILLKAAKLRLPVLISRAAPTSLSIELAEALNITLIGFVRGRRMNVYTHSRRVPDLFGEDGVQ